MAGGAVIAAAAGARRRRRTEVIDAFLEAGATAPGLARRVDELLDGYHAEVRELAAAGVVVNVAVDQRWYLDEAAYALWLQARRETLPRRILVRVAVALLVGVALVELAAGIAASRVR